MAWVWLLAGAALLAVAADRLVAGSAALALRTGISPLLIGLTIVAFATSSPELFVSLLAAWQGKPEIAVGNVVGSNIANIGLVLAMAAIITRVPGDHRVVRREMPLMVAAVGLLFVLLWNGSLSRLEGVFLLFLLVGFVLWQWRLAAEQRQSSPAASEVLAFSGTGIGRAWLYVALGTVGLYLGSEAFLHGAVDIGRSWGLSEAVIGLTLVSVGTSLPELAATVVGAWKRQVDMILGNIIGSNIFNIFAVLGITASFIPLSIADIGPVDLSVMLGFSVLVLAIFFWRGAIGRGLGLGLLAIYVAYLVFLFA
ncbi:cation:H+ antiporter [Ectothiorhodosinus mongolicus]|uniref:Cation:H+ antiporter n=1 Tax=Ectothiorhodosinus mongolicus TaxID=233100 RepID=A0A1R3VPF6_9GAMM|nr:calcium/sodium antiporter [Ectothiorhodosinus mongolicus]ULX56622.1 hypothetical protein CKX93_02200 [Ectothiorhodosinus mongolicus]SIT66542.1 cation:H+ antiporter [Ectothiorhodosinus mongolicus]